MIRRTLPLVAAVLACAACGDRSAPSSPSARTQHEVAASLAAAEASDAAFEREMGEPKARPAEKPAVKPAAEKPKPAEAARPAVKPKPAAEAKPPVARGRPDWADQPPSEAGKLFAVGTAARGKRDAARAKARQELAAQLKVRIQGQTSVNESEITRIGPGGERVGRAVAAYRNEAKATVDRDLDFTSVVAEAEDERESYALVQLDRAAWTAKLRQELATVDGKLAEVAERFAKAPPGLRPAAQAMRSAGLLVAQRDALLADLAQADPQGQPPACPVDLQALFAACARGLASVSIKVEGAPDAVFAARTQDAMARTGLVVNERDGSVVLRLALRETPRKLPNGWTKVSVAGSATVVDPATGTVAGSLQVDEAGTDPDAGQARAKMLDNASAAIAREVDARLLDLLGQ